MTTTEYLVPDYCGRAELEVKKSRFIAVVGQIHSPEQARVFVAEQRQAHSTARHHCSAYILGSDRSVERSHDDGEPAGTAGMPILQVLRGSGLSDLIGVVTRYFGGTLLGTGGLTRAYADSMALALAQTTSHRRALYTVFELAVDHAYAGRLEAELRHRGVLIRDAQYHSSVLLRLVAPVGALDWLPNVIAAHTLGNGVLKEVGPEWVNLA